jgi:hypothetical protein
MTTSFTRIKWNKTPFYQGTNPDDPPAMYNEATLINELFQTVNEFNTTWPTRMNTKDEQLKCAHCNTAFRISETKQGHCPFCWRLI